MLDLKELEELAKKSGFSYASGLDVATIELRDEVRQMCAENKCRMYGKNWCCPPGCGTLSECGERIRKYKNGILVQTMMEMEDEMDVETMMDAEAAHKEHFEQMRVELQKKYPEMLAIGSGTCTRCKTCTYPDAPCRFPEHSFASMEAYGMLVTDICRANGMKYYYGPCTITYTSCFLLE